MTGDRGPRSRRAARRAACRAAGRAVAVAGAVMVVVALLPVTRPAPAGAAGSPRGELRRAATGRWRGAFGTVDFGDDGTATFTMRGCGFLPKRPGFVQAFTDCEPETTSGSVTVGSTGYRLRQADGTTLRYSAYVDGTGALHVGFSAAGEVGADRRGTITIQGSERLVVRPGRCEYRAAFLDQPVRSRCRYVRRGGREILLFRAPDLLEPAGTSTQGYVYVPERGLLVGPELVERVFTR